jgi:hypothetical protein
MRQHKPHNIASTFVVDLTTVPLESLPPAARDRVEAWRRKPDPEPDPEPEPQIEAIPPEIQAKREPRRFLAGQRARLQVTSNVLQLCSEVLRHCDDEMAQQFAVLVLAQAINVRIAARELKFLENAVSAAVGRGPLVPSNRVQPSAPPP